MNNAYLTLPDGPPIPLRIKQWERKTFIECRFSEPFMKALGISLNGNSLSDTFLKGVCTPGDGGVFQLFDKFGSVATSCFRVPEHIVHEKLIGAMIWEIQSR